MAVWSVARARELQDRAKTFYHQADYEKSLRHTLRARELTRSAIGSMDKPLNAGQVENALRRTDELIERAKSEAASQNRPDNQTILERIISHQDMAWQEFRRGRLKASLARTKLARNLVHRLLG